MHEFYDETTYGEFTYDETAGMVNPPMMKAPMMNPPMMETPRTKKWCAQMNYPLRFTDGRSRCERSTIG